MAEFNKPLSDEEVLEIRRLANTLSNKEIAARFNKPASTISEIINRNRYAHIPPEEGVEVREKTKWIRTAKYGEIQRYAEGIITSIPYPEECIIWPFKPGTAGRGVINSGGKTYSAPNYICRRVYGDPPPMHEAAHNCGRGKFGCINPAHLRWATPKDNALDDKVFGTSGYKLTSKDVLEIRLSERSYGSQVKLAEKYGIDVTHVWEIVHRRVYKWLNDDGTINKENM
jgi:hypothetical protein